MAFTPTLPATPRNALKEVATYAETGDAAVLSDARVLRESAVITDPRWAGVSPPATDGTGNWKPVFDALKAYNSGAVVAQGAKIVLPPLAYGVSAPVVLPGTVTLEGPSFSFAGFGSPNNPSRGARIVALAGFAPGANTNGGTETNGIVQWSGTAYPPNATAGTADEDETGGGASSVIFDCRALANGPQTLGRRSLFKDCWSLNPLKNCYVVTGQNCRYQHCIGSCKNVATSSVFWVENWDNKIWNCEGRDFTTAYINARPGCTGLQVIGGTCYGAGIGLRVFETAVTGGQIQVNGMMFDDCGDNPAIYATTTGTGRIQTLNVSGCYFYKNGDWGTGDSSQSIMWADAGAGTQIVSQITGCSVTTPGTSMNWRSFMEKSGGTGTVSAAMTGVDARGMTSLWYGPGGADRAAGWTPRMSNVIAVSKAGAVKRSEIDFKVSLTGDAAATTFNAAHGLGVNIPDKIIGVETSLAAPIAHSVTSVDATNAAIKFATAPPAGAFTVYGTAKG